MGQIGVLQRLTVQDRADAGGTHVHLVRTKKQRAEGCGAIPCFALQPLVGLVLVVPHSDIVGDRVAQDVFEGGLGGDPTTRTADHNGELRFIVDLLGFSRDRDRAIGGDEAVGVLGEEDGVGREVSLRLRDVRMKIQPDTEDLLRSPGGRQQLDRACVDDGVFVPIGFSQRVEAGVRVDPPDSPQWNVLFTVDDADVLETILPIRNPSHQILVSLKPRQAGVWPPQRFTV
nr:hypothetical protein [Kribbella qitaiheensis]